MGLSEGLELILGKYVTGFKLKLIKINLKNQKIIIKNVIDISI